MTAKRYGEDLLRANPVHHISVLVIFGEAVVRRQLSVYRKIADFCISILISLSGILIVVIALGRLLLRGARSRESDIPFPPALYEESAPSPSEPPEPLSENDADSCRLHGAPPTDSKDPPADGT